MSPSMISLQTALRSMQTAMYNMQTTMRQCAGETQATAENTTVCGGTNPAMTIAIYLLVIMLAGLVLLAFATFVDIWNSERKNKQPMSTAAVISVVCAIINIGILLLLMTQ